MKDKILKRLREQAPARVSGEVLSRALKVSRTAVWKYINELRSEGYVIGSSSRTGYKLIASPDRLSRPELEEGLDTSVLGRRFYILDSVDSTNAYAKKLADDGVAEGAVVLAEQMTAGRGRLGRDWSAVKGGGIWLSVILRPDILPGEVQVVTLAAAAAVAEALETAAGIRAGIKWPNDIILDGSKLCGILTELISEADRVNYLVLGIGINISQKRDEFPPEVRDKAISLKMYAEKNGLSLDKFNRNVIIRELLLSLEKLYIGLKKGDTSRIIDLWNKYSATLGKNVRISWKGGDYTGVAQELTPEGNLVVMCTDGVRREAVSGEVSIRGMLGYV